MAADYSHSIRNRLFLVLSGDELEYAVTNNDGALITSGRSAVTDKAMLQDVLDNTVPLSEIYSSVDLTWSGCNFVVYPQAFTDSADQRKIFVTSHKLRVQERLIHGSIYTDISLTFAVPNDLLQVVKTKYPNLTYHHEVERLFAYTFKKTKTLNESIAISNGPNHSILIVNAGQEVKLINQFETKNIDDLFYYTMLSVEQLDLNIEELHLHCCVAKQTTSFDQLDKMFKPYVKHIHKLQLDDNISTALFTAIACV